MSALEAEDRRFESCHPDSLLYSLYFKYKLYSKYYRDLSGFLRLTVRTLPFHGENMSSILIGSRYSIVSIVYTSSIDSTVDTEE